MLWDCSFCIVPYRVYGMNKTEPVLILAGAVRAELLPFASIDQAIVEVGSLHRRIVLQETGIGNVSAAIALMRWQAEAFETQTQIDEVIFIGSCGAYDLSAKILSVVFSNRFCSYELGSLVEPMMAKSLPAANQMIVTDQGPVGQLMSSKADEVVVNAINAVSLVSISPDRLQLMSDTTLPFVENLECFGLARAALESNIKFSALMAVTNHVCADGSSQWMANHNEAASKVSAVIHDVLFEKK